MNSYIGNWVYRKSSVLWRGWSCQSQLDDATQPPPLPFLPVKRSNALTPTSSREDLRLPMTSSVTDSQFFQWLPADLRRMILLEAFGSRTVHIDLSFDQLRSKEWRWNACVCHRGQRGAEGQELVLNSWDDNCLFDNDARRENSEESIGPMGWLRACRQAYLEGIEILYSTNKLHMSNVSMIQNLPSLLRPEHLAMVSSVEMVWQLGVVAQPPTGYDHVAARDRRFLGWTTFNDLLQVTPTSLPNLRHLHVCLIGTWYPPQMAPNDRARRSELDLLVPVDAMVRRFGSRMQECNVAIPSSIFRARWGGNQVKNGPKDSSSKAWRHLTLLQEQIDRLGIDSSSQEARNQGYWVIDGKDELTHSFAPT